MVTNHAKLLQQIHEYVDEYIAHIGDNSTVVTPQVHQDLLNAIADLEDLQKYPEQAVRVDHVAKSIATKEEHVRQLRASARSHPRVSHAKRTLAQSFQDYIAQEVDYLVNVGSRPHREQINLLLGDIIADLKALALHPSDQQALLISADLERKRQQVEKLQRSWQELRS